MFFYLLFVLFAYYILKPVSRAMFLNKFDIDKLPSLYILIAVAGGFLAYFYSKLAAKTSLRIAVFWAMALSVACLVVMWWLIRMRLSWMIYVLNVWVSLFSVVLVSQGWLVASNLFNAREAKRLYGLLGLGMVMGAAFGGEFTRRTAVLVGTDNLLLASAAMVVLAYASFRVALYGSGKSLERARAAEAEETQFSIRDMVRDVGRTRHLQVIMGIMVVTFIVDVLVEYQFQAMAKTAYRGDQLTAFFGSFYGLWLNLTEFVFQFFLTAAVVSRFGVGGTLQIMPVAILGCSVATLAAPGVISTAAVRLTEASTRYTLNRTGMELLYLPLPGELRNRVKAFVDIFVDRFSRGLGGVLLVVVTSGAIHFGVRSIAGLVMVLTGPWILLTFRARKEYVATVRKRLETRRLDLDTARVNVNDPDTLRLVETAARSANPRQAAYALTLLADYPGYDATPLFVEAAGRGPAELRARVYELMRGRESQEIAAIALENARTPGSADAPPAVTYLLSVAADPRRTAAEFLDSHDPRVVEGALQGISRELAQDLITRDWLEAHAGSADPRQRALAAQATAVRGDEGTEVLHHLLADSDPQVREAACRAAGALHNRAYLFTVVELLGSARLRAAAIDALAGYGPAICGTLGDLLLDESVSRSERRQIPRVLKRIPHQRAVDALLTNIGHPDLTLRTAVLKALNRLRETAPELNFENNYVTEQIMAEARYFYELNAALAPFRGSEQRGTAANLLARTIQERLRQTLERLFRLLGLRYPPKEIYAAYLALSRNVADQHTAALEFLDNVLERNLKRILLPLLDAPEHVIERGRELFGVEIMSAEQAIRELIRSGDPWLVACAIAAAAELKLRSLAPDIHRAAEHAEDDVCTVARSAEAMLAA